jgi:hypothetical protein
MKLVQVIQDYVDLKQAIGSRFHAEAVILKAFARSVGDLTMPEVTAEHVNAYLAGHHDLEGYCPIRRDRGR